MALALLITALTAVNFRHAVRQRIGDLLEMVLIEPSYLRFCPHELSGGTQRVCLALALALQRNSCASTSRATLYMTPDLLSARLLADEILVLNAGRIVESGPALEAIRNSRDDYTKLRLPNPSAAQAESISKFSRSRNRSRTATS